jgi:hypothetical protein
MFLAMYVQVIDRKGVILEMRQAKCGEVVEKERTVFCRGFANYERE